MKKDEWKVKITDICTSAGLYKPYFDTIIEALADLLEKKDIADQAWREAGSKSTIIYANGNAGCEPNLKVYMELNSQAIKHWSELGLTPSAYKKLTGETAGEKEEPKGLAAALASLER